MMPNAIIKANVPTQIMATRVSQLKLCQRIRTGREFHMNERQQKFLRIDRKTIMKRSCILTGIIAMNTCRKDPPDFQHALERTYLCSRYAKRVLDAEPHLLGWLEKNHLTCCDRAEISGLIEHTGLDLNDEAQLTRAVRIV